MKASRKPAYAHLMLGASAAALALTAQQAVAQEAAPQAAAPQAAADSDPAGAIVVTGIRASLKSSLNIKRQGIGVIDAISAEDIGKFPDTNLAESLQRITGVSIDRANGEGSTVTVRGFGPDYNLVLLNGRQMPASSLGGSSGAPASRSFDFANLASEGIAGVEVYKSGRASLATGGIGSVINIKTPRPLDRPGLHGSIGAKALYDTSVFEGQKVKPEFSGVISDTFADNRIGISISGSYQDRRASQAQFNAGWREGYLGNENNWGSLPVDANDWRGNFDKTENRPGPNTVYQVTQNAGYDFTTFRRERINGQAVVQVKPTDTLVATVDYTFSQNTIDARTNSIGVWFNHNQTSSSWTDGPAAGPNFYAESFGPNEGKDLAITGAVAANRSINRSIGGNLKWDGPGGLRLELDGHHSTAESKPTSPYGTGIAVGSAIYGVKNQKVDFTSDMPVISVEMYPGAEINAANIRPAGNAFRTAYMRDEINEVAFRGGYDFDASFIDSLDFGVTYTENKVRSAFGVIQNDTWGGTLSKADTPDELYTIRDLPNDLKGMNVSGNGIIPSYFDINTPGLINLLNDKLGICGNAQTAGTCLAKFDRDRTIRERTFAPYIQTTHTFDLGENPAHLRMGLRYEKTKVDSSALVPVPTGTVWTGGNETAIIYGTESSFVTRKGEYENWLPAIDFDMSPFKNFKFRASYSHTITRPDYNSLQGGTTLDAPIRIGGSTGASGNPNLLPYKSKGVDISGEWYYGPTSYISVGFFHKVVKNYINQTQVNQPAFGLTNAAAGDRAKEARAALGSDATAQQILNYIGNKYPQTVAGRDANNNVTGVKSLADDPLVNFIVTQPTNSDQRARIWGWEFAIQHTFWNTGFGAIVNYTVVKSDTKFDNAKRYTVPQFAVTGISNSANAVLYYDKKGLQARVAYNWRAGFLSGYGFDPYYVNPYGQWDVSASYEIKKGVTVFGEGINITNADRKGHMRNDQTVFFAAPGYARWAAGARFTF
ncbi:TonB-dependent receptor [Novosphingobium sediminis]|uniref:TonB-dependent receptor n=1 Tax=Novosphingobium sediminis TaxID=707214 RepID=A0A512AFS4_9SPHN|nr:TonB-dependent receptor [Novosphingobium sediminis]GEN98554.1 TonB-dependent receptor [Novosphingobium sediminis]